MKSSYCLKALLVFSGLLAIGIGGSLLFNPVAFHAASGLSLVNEAGLLSEVRASGGVLLVFGAVILLGAFIKSLELTAVWLGSLVYLSYGLSRVFSMQVDGMPGENLMIATVIELVIGSVLFFYLSLRKDLLYVK